MLPFLYSIKKCNEKDISGRSAQSSFVNPLYGYDSNSNIDRNNPSYASMSDPNRGAIANRTYEGFESNPEYCDVVPDRLEGTVANSAYESPGHNNSALYIDVMPGRAVGSITNKTYVRIDGFNEAANLEEASVKPRSFVSETNL